MKISEIKIYKYELPLKRDLVIANNSITSRKGFIVEITDTNNNKAYGEAAPLEGYSIETIDEAFLQLLLIKKTFTNFKELQLDGFVPSVRFAIESALSEFSGTTNEELTDQAVTVNALLTGANATILTDTKQKLSEGFKIFKLKVGRQKLSDDILLVTDVLNIIGNSSLLRLDANKAWSVDEVVQFFDKIIPNSIDYIEEPLADITHYSELYNKVPTAPIALDESLANLSDDDLNSLTNLKAIVLKPTMLGFKRCLSLIDYTYQKNLQPVISSTFESSVGIHKLIKLSAFINKKFEKEIAVGLDTVDWFTDDLLTVPLGMKNHQYNLKDLQPINNNIIFEKLTEVGI